ncbi:MAG: glucosyltransferase domain-containing protein [Lachnospiraceae bacterium]|nr:glucosyltransferase domain-containing protein [Lachnospiraceae bacterium]
MSLICREAQKLFQSKKYIICMLVTLFATFGSLLVRPTIGIDDTAWKVYFLDGVAPVMGRWVLFILNKIIPIAEYNPFIVELLFLFFFFISATLWVILLKRIIADHVSEWTYVFFGCAFLASPITSEVVTYYLANGIFIGFGFTALAVWYLWDSFEKGITGRKRVQKVVASGLWLWLALGCYESFIIVYMVAICVCYCFDRGIKSKEEKIPVFPVLIHTLLAGILCVVLRSVWTQLMIVLFSLQDQINILDYRGIGDILNYFSAGNGAQDIALIFKQFFVKYYINAVVYKPITFLVMGFGLLGLWALIRSIQKKDFIILLSVIGAMIMPWMLTILEGYATYYRTSQYIVLMNAVIVPVAALMLEKVKDKRYIKAIGFFLAVLLVYHEAHEMNYWLKVDQDKYEDACRTADAVALEIIRDYDENLPICIVGEYNVPEAIASKSYCPTWSKRTTIATWAIGLLDEEMIQDYMEPAGYRFAETPLLSVIKWGSVAFYATDIEMVKFWENRGFQFIVDRNPEHYLYGKELLEEGMPSWPEKGSILQMEDCIIVNLDNNR